MIDERILKHKVVILEGLPGCGKTTLASKLVKEQGRVLLTTFPNRKEGAVEIIRAAWHWPTAHIEGDVQRRYFRHCSDSGTDKANLSGR